MSGWTLVSEQDAPEASAKGASNGGWEVIQEQSPEELRTEAHQQSSATIDSVTRPQSPVPAAPSSASLSLGVTPAKPRSIAEGLTTEQQERRGGMPLVLAPGPPLSDRPENYHSLPTGSIIRGTPGTEQRFKEGLARQQQEDELHPLGPDELHIAPVGLPNQALAPPAQAKVNVQEPSTVPVPVGSKFTNPGKATPQEAAADIENLKSITGVRGYGEIARNFNKLVPTSTQPAPTTKESEIAATGLLKGATTAATPLMIATALTAPEIALLAAGGAEIGGAGVKKLAQIVHASPETQDLVEQAGQIAGGFAGGAAYGGLRHLANPESALTDLLWKRGYIRDKSGDPISFGSETEARATAQEILRQNPGGIIESAQRKGGAMRAAGELPAVSPAEAARRASQTAQADDLSRRASAHADDVVAKFFAPKTLGGQADTPASEPAPAAPQPSGPVSAAANSMAQAEANASQARMRAAGVPPPPPPAPPQIADQPGAPPELKQGHIPQKLVDSFAGIVSVLPENLRAQAIQEAHGTLARVILEGSQKGPMVGPDGKLIAPVKDIEGASKVAIGLINDAIGAHDKVAAAAEKEAAKGAGAVSGEATRSSITKTRAALKKAGEFEVVGEESKGVESENGIRTEQPSTAASAEPGVDVSNEAGNRRRVETPDSGGASGSHGNQPAPISNHSVSQADFQVIGEEPRPQKFQKGEQVLLSDGRKGTVDWIGTNPQGKDIARVRDEKGQKTSVEASTLKSPTSEPSQAKTPAVAEGNAPQHILWSRHGETELDVDATNETVAGWTPEPLDERGIASAKKLAGEVKEHKPTVIISSDLERAKQTADIVGKELGIPVKTDERLRPQHVPETEGLKVGAAKPIWQDFEDNPDKKPEGGESWKEFETRQAGAIKDIHDLIAKGERPMVVTHSRNLESAIGERPEPGEFVKKEVERRIADVAKPERDTNVMARLEKEHPEWSLSRRLQEAAAITNPAGGKSLASKTEEGVVAKPEGGASPAPVKAENPPTGVQAAGETPKYKFGNTQANIPAGSEAHGALESARARISNSDLAGEGKDVDGNHVTVRYGIKGEDVEGVKKYLASLAPFEASLGKTEKFPPTEHSEGAAVIHAPIEAPELHKINSELEKHGDFTEPSFRAYQPHATVAYVKPEKADRYVGMSVTDGKKFPVNEIQISDRFGNQQSVKLEGKKPGLLERAKNAVVSAEQKVHDFVNSDTVGLGEEINRRANENLEAMKRRSGMAAVERPSGGEPKGQFSEKDLEPTSKDEALEAEIKSLKDQAAKVSQEFSLQSLKGYDPHSPLRAKYNDLMKQVLAREDDLARLRGEPTRAEKREMQEKEAAKTFADRPKQSLSYGDPKQSQHWQVLEPDYIEKRFGDKVKQYERAVPEKQAEVDGLKAGTVKHTTAEANLKYWEDLLSKYKARDPRQAQTFKNEYIDLVKKAVSHGSPVPNAVIGQHPEFKVAQNARERYEKGRHTSFANKSIAVNDTMRKEEGFKVKRQDGKAITEEQIKEISGGVDDMVKVLGPELRDMMRGTELTISHTNGKHPFLSDAGGMYHPVDRTISAGIDDFLGRPVRALAHELGHWLDYESGRVLNTKALIRPKSGGPSMETKYVSESDRQTKPLYELARRTMSDTRQAEKMVKTVKLSDLPDQERADIERMKVVLGPYWHEPRELWARMFEQHIGTTLGRGGLASESPESYQNRPAWWTSEAWVKLAPLFEEALKTRMDAMRERYAPKAIEGVSEAKPAPLPTVNGSYEFSKPVVPPKPKIPTKAEVTELEREYGATAQRSTNPDVDLAVGRARGRWQDAKKAYEAAQSVKAEWHNLEEKIVWRGKTMTRAEAIAQEPNANDEILAARPAASYGPKSPPAQTYQEWVAGGRKGLGPAGITKEKDLLGDWFDKLKAGTPGGRGSIIDKIPKDIVKAMYEMAPEDRPISLLPGELRKMHDRLGLPVESLLDRAIKDGAQPIKPVEDVPKAGANFEGRYVRAALEQVAEEWEKITSKSADVEFSKPKTENGHQTLHARLVDGSGVVKIQERGHPHDDYGIYEFAPGKPENLLSASETLARAKDQAESILQSGNFPGGKSKMPKEFKTDKLVIKVPGDGTFVIPNHPAAINHAIEATEEFVPTKEGSSARRVPGSPKEFNAEKYITGVEKEIASLEDDLAKALPNQKVYIAEQLKAARENLAEAKSAKSDRSGERESLLAGESGEASPAKLAEAVTKATGAVGDYIRSEAHLNQIARQLQSGMYDLEAEHSGRVLEAVHTMEKVAKEYGERKGDFLADAEQVYFHQEDPTGITLNKDQDTLLDDKVLPLMEDTDNKFKALKELDGQQAKLIDNYVHRVTKGKGGWLDRIVSDMKKGTGRGNLVSKSAPQTKGRTMMAIESPSGDRRVVSIKGGKATMWENGQTTDLGEIKNAKGRTDEENETFPEGQENSAFYDEGKIVEGPDGYDWKITQATTKEIEADTGIQYYHNALASALVSNLQVSKALRGAQFIEAFKKSPQFKEIAFKGAKPPDGWKITQLPQMKDYYFEPHVAEVLDWYADRLRGGDPGIMEKVGNFLRTSIFFNPLIHVPNITVHWLTERGLRGYNPVRFPDTAKAGLKAINAVIHQNQDFLDALEAGAPLQSHREDIAKVTQLFFDQLTEGLEKKEDWALALAKQIGMSPITLIKGIYRFSGKATWVTNDIAVLQSAYEKMQRSKGMSLSDALKETSKHIPDYRLPTRMLNSRALAKVLSNPSITMFMAYHYGAAKSYGEAAKSAIGMGGGGEEPPEGGGGSGEVGEESEDSGKRTKAGEIAHGWELLATIGLVTFVLYPLLDKLVQAASGDKNAKMRRAGAATLPYNVYQAATHQKSVGDVVQSVATPAVQTKAVAELIANRDFFTGKNIYDPTSDWYTQGQQVGRRLVESISPIGQASRVVEGGAEARKRFGWGLVGVSFPKTRAERLASQIAMGKTGTKAQSPEDREDYIERRDILDELRKGNRRPLMEAERTHAITPQQAHTIERRARRDPLADTVYNFSMGEVKKVLEAAKADDNKQQVELLQKVIREKRLHLLMRGQVEPAPESAVQ